MSIAQNELNDVAARAKRRFPDHKVDLPFHVCLPVYELRLKATEITEDSLSTPARFVLQLSDLDVTQPAEVGKLLGMSQSYVASAAAELLGENLVVQSPWLSLGITNLGNRFSEMEAGHDALGIDISESHTIPSPTGFSI